MTIDLHKSSAETHDPCPVCGDTDGLGCSLPNCPNGQPDDVPFGGDFDYCMKRIEWHFTSLIDENSHTGAVLLSRYYAAKTQLFALKKRAAFEFEMRVAGSSRDGQK